MKVSHKLLSEYANLRERGRGRDSSLRERVRRGDDLRQGRHSRRGTHNHGSNHHGSRDSADTEAKITVSRIATQTISRSRGFEVHDCTRPCRGAGGAQRSHHHHESRRSHGQGHSERGRGHGDSRRIGKHTFQHRKGSAVALGRAERAERAEQPAPGKRLDASKLIATVGKSGRPEPLEATKKAIQNGQKLTFNRKVNDVFERSGIVKEGDRVYARIDELRTGVKSLNDALEKNRDKVSDQAYRSLKRKIARAPQFFKRAEGYVKNATREGSRDKLARAELRFDRIEKKIEGFLDRLGRGDKIDDGDIGFDDPQPLPIDPDPVDTNPVDTDPVDTNPVDTDPVDTNPVDTDPVDTNPVDTDPVDTNPVDTDPVDTNPVDTAPPEEGASGTNTPKFEDSGALARMLNALGRAQEVASRLKNNSDSIDRSMVKVRESVTVNMVQNHTVTVQTRGVAALKAGHLGQSKLGGVAGTQNAQSKAGAGGRSFKVVNADEAATKAGQQKGGSETQPGRAEEKAVEASKTERNSLKAQRKAFRAERKQIRADYKADKAALKESYELEQSALIEQYSTGGTAPSDETLQSHAAVQDFYDQKMETVTEQRDQNLAAVMSGYGEGDELSLEDQIKVNEINRAFENKAGRISTITTALTEEVENGAYFKDRQAITDAIGSAADAYKSDRVGLEQTLDDNVALVQAGYDATVRIYGEDSEIGVMAREFAGYAIDSLYAEHSQQVAGLQAELGDAISGLEFERVDTTQAAGDPEALDAALSDLKAGHKSDLKALKAERDVSLKKVLEKEQALNAQRLMATAKKEDVAEADQNEAEATHESLNLVAASAEAMKSQGAKLLEAHSGIQANSAVKFFVSRR